MKRNGVAETLQTIGIIEGVFGGGISFLLILVALADKNFSLIFIGIILFFATFVVCMIFCGFAEIIKLLQINCYQQELILQHFNIKDLQPKYIVKPPLKSAQTTPSQPSATKQVSKTVCAKCNKTFDKGATFCPFCGEKHT